MGPTGFDYVFWEDGQNEPTSWVDLARSGVFGWAGTFTSKMVVVCICFLDKTFFGLVLLSSSIRLWLGAQVLSNPYVTNWPF